MKHLWLLLALCLTVHAQTNTLSIRNKLQVLSAKLKAAALTNRLVVIPPKTNLLLSWKYSGPTNTDVVIYATTNLTAKFPTDWRNVAILPGTQTNLIVPNSQRWEFFRQIGYDPNTGLTSRP